MSPGIQGSSSPVLAGHDGRTVLFVVVGAVTIFALFVAVLVLLFVRQVREDDPPTRPVSIDATLTPVSDGVEVNAIVKANTGALPEFRVLPEQIESYYGTKGADRAQINARAEVRDLTVDGAPTAPGATIRPSGSTVELRFVVARRDDGRRVVWIGSHVHGLRSTSVTVRTDGSPVGCLVPEGGQSMDDYFTYRECGPFPVTARAELPTVTGYSPKELPAVVRVAFDPPSP